MYETMPWLGHYGAAPRNVEIPGLSLFGLLARDLEARPELPALEFMGRTTTRRRLLERITLASRAFAAAGIAPGERVIVCLPNCPQAVVAVYALSRLGAVPAPIHPLSTTSEIAAFARIVGARTALVLDAFHPRFAPLAGGEGPFALLVAASLGPEMGFPTSLGFALGPGRKIARPPYGERVRSWASLEAGAAGLPELARPDPLGPDEEALILFSGGSSGEPKAVLLSSRAVNALAVQTNAAGGPIRPGQAMLSILPLFHGFGLAVGVHAILCHGGTCVLVPRFKAEDIPALVRRHRPAFMAGVPTLFDALAADPAFARAPLSSFTGLFCGGDSLPPETKRRFEAALRKGGCGASLREGYGMTESVTANMLMPAEEYRERSIGVPYPGMLAKVVRPGSFEECPPGEDGEICVTGPTLMLGYLGDPAATEEALRLHPDGRTWLHSGDIGSMDRDGFFYFKQRAKRVIKSSGVAVYPTQVEEVLAAHPAVRLACVIGVPHPTRVETPKAFVALKEGIEPAEALRGELLALCAERLNTYARPKELEFLPELPLTKVGKVAYRVLEEREAARRAAEKAADGTPGARS